MSRTRARTSGPFGRLSTRVWVIALALCVAPGPALHAQLLSPGKLAASHAELEGIRQCTACHELGKRGISPERCLDCHEPIARRIAEDRGYHATVSGNCADCHKDHLGLDFDLLHLDESTFDHTAAGYLLEAGHRDAACRDCHRPANVTDPAATTGERARANLTRTFLGVSRDCAVCHREDDPHDGQFAGRTCADCHDAQDWRVPALFDHERAEFRLEGLHATVDCAACHGAAPDPVVYRPLRFGDCADCHADPHQGRMAGTCASCHDVGGWRTISGADFERTFDHGRTSFRLAGAHAAADCRACHVPGRPPSGDLLRMRYRAGTANATYPRPVAETCGSCHVDRHALPDAEGRWPDCATCHSEARWAPSSFDLARHAASFPLEGAHAATPCLYCHQVPERGHDRFVLAIDGSTCASCHEADDPHEDLYAGLGCELCHGTDAFDTPRFDHPPTVLDEGPVPRTCASCHAGDDPHLDQFAGRDCAACHGTDAFTVPDFDHGTTRFPLDGAHQATPCAACHPTVEHGSGAYVVYRPLGFDCVDCHGGAR